MSPTIITPATTQAGIILGTAAYMSPGQARGKTVDRRADVWVLGAVLFEMRTGQRAFPGENLLFISPDSQWVGLVSGRMVNKISVQARGVVPLGGEANVTGGDMGRRCQPTGFTLRRKTGGAVAYLATPDDRLRISNN